MLVPCLSSSFHFLIIRHSLEIMIDLLWYHQCKCMGQLQHSDLICHVSLNNCCWFLTLSFLRFSFFFRLLVLSDSWYGFCMSHSSSYFSNLKLYRRTSVLMLSSWPALLLMYDSENLIRHFLVDFMISSAIMKQYSQLHLLWNSEPCSWYLSADIFNSPAWSDGHVIEDYLVLFWSHHYFSYCVVRSSFHLRSCSEVEPDWSFSWPMTPSPHQDVDLSVFTQFDSKSLETIGTCPE